MSHSIFKAYIIISNTQTLAEQFKSFYKEHNPKNMEDALEKFSIFGGVSWGNIDTSKSSIELIQKLILNDYRYIRNDINDLTSGAPLYHSMLTAIAQGNGQTHSIFKRAGVSNEIGERAIQELCQKEVIESKKSKKTDNRFFFRTPFIRFWFAFVSPLFKGIRDGNYDEIIKKFANNEREFFNLTFIELSHELIKLLPSDDKITNISTYWDNEIELDIYAKTKSGKIVVGSCKYINSKVKKSELSNLKELCKKADIKADIFVIVTKNGFSNELKSLKNENLKLITLKSFKKLVE